MRVTDEMVLAGAREVCARWSKACGVDPEDNWKVYSDEHKEEARAILEAALAQQAGAVDTNGEFEDWFQAWATSKGLTMMKTADGRYLCPDTALAEAAYSSACMTAAIWHMDLCRQESLASSWPGGGGEGGE